MAGRTRTGRPEEDHSWPPSSEFNGREEPAASGSTFFRTVGNERSEAPSDRPAGPHGYESAERVELEVVFEILRTRRRREALRCLDANGGEATIGDLAEYIAAKENDVERSEIRSSERKRVYVGLYQLHLPKMDRNGIVNWEEVRGVVELRDSAWWLLAYLYFDPEEPT